MARPAHLHPWGRGPQARPPHGHDICPFCLCTVSLPAHSEPRGTGFLRLAQCWSPRARECPCTPPGEPAEAGRAEHGGAPGSVLPARPGTPGPRRTGKASSGSRPHAARRSALWKAASIPTKRGSNIQGYSTFGFLGRHSTSCSDKPGWIRASGFLGAQPRWGPGAGREGTWASQQEQRPQGPSEVAHGACLGGQPPQGDCPALPLLQRPHEPNRQAFWRSPARPDHGPHVA